MVDSINPSGSSSSVFSVGKTQKFEDKSKTETANTSAPVDELKLSDEAISLTQAQKSANEVSSSLKGTPDATLSSDTQRLNALV